ncbi:CDP-2,3-bis-(O-geranylgeranyl)-sn-glycerol synthase [Candidatus Micrarchaeota archaeon]|nr:CDP-2,3-bis-(O-geranylgeranyl)-sn-glycerol synthase [Candidatus Micrarchaeota archaeon]
MDLVSLILYIFPAYVANSAPVLFGGGAPIDFKRHLPDGNRLLGNSKTLRGLGAGLAAGMFAGVLLAYLLPNMFLPFLSFRLKIWVAFLLASGTLFGDLLGSFIKRRMNLKPGEPFFLTDQLLFLVMALAFSSLVFIPSYSEIIYLFLLTFILHVLLNILAHRLNLKRVPW